MQKIDKIKQLRQITGISVIGCKKALEAVDYNLEEAKLILSKQLDKFSQGKAQRKTNEGIIASYIHPNKKIGVLLEILSESDFVAKSKDFQTLAHEICLQIAAMKPLFVKPEDIGQEFLAGEIRIFREQFKDSGKSKKLIDEIIGNKLKKYKEEISLLSQPWIKDETKTIGDLIREYIAKLGENIVVRKFVRFQI